MPRKFRRLWKSRDIFGRTVPAARRRKRAIAASELAAIEKLEDRSLLSGAPPVVIASASPLVFNENGGPIAIDNALSVTDPGELLLIDATVTIDGYAASQDILAFTNQNGITGSFNTTTGVLTLTGLSSIENYQAALRSVTFSNISENPSTKPRSLTIQVNDGTGVGTASRALVVNSINDTAIAANDSYTVEQGNTLNVVAGKISAESTQFISSVAMTGNTGEKPMSKVWKHAGTWWAVFSDENSTNVWRLDGTVWTSVLDLSARTSVKADVKVVGDVVHVLMKRTSATELRSIQFVPGASGSPGTYQFWSTQPNLVTLPAMGNLEAAVFQIDSTGKMWVAYESGGQIRVRHSNAPYNSWSAEIVLAASVSTDDIAGIIALPTGQIGVFWSNQTTQHYGFRIHVDGTDPSTWLVDEVPAGNTAVAAGGGMADDHMSLAVKADGTLYVAVKTSYNTSSQPRLMLLVRRPNGTWDTPYDIDTDRLGTRPIIQLSAVDGRLLYFYRNTDGNGPIVYREITDNGTAVTRGPETILLNGDSVVPVADVNNVSGSKASFTDDLTVIASTNGRLTSARLLYRYGVLANDTDVDGDILTTQLVTGPAHGTLTLNANGTFTYTHDGSNTATDSFTYHAVDASGNSNLATVTFTINAPTNFPPVGVNNSYSVAEGGTLNASDANGTNSGIADGVLVNDSDPEGLPLTAVLVSNPAHGTFTLNDNGTFTYVHNGSENFSDSFTYRPHDGNQPGNLTTVSLTITPVNDAPVGVSESYNVSQGGTLAANDATGTVGGSNDNGVLLNDSDAEGSTLTAVLVTGPAHGTLTLNANGTFTYVHDNSSTTSDSFTYRPNDGSTNGNLVTVTIAVSNTPPVGNADSYSVAEGGTLVANDTTGTVGGANDNGVLVNDTDAQNQTLTATLVSGPAHGTLTLNANGTFTYAHNGSENFSDSFTYRPHDGVAQGNVTTVSITISPVNDLPVGINDSYVAARGGTLTANDAAGTSGGPNDNGVLANDTDAEGSTLNAVLVTGPAHGTLTLNANGTFTYVHNGDTATSDSFTYRANDGTASGNLTTVAISIQDIQQPVTAQLQDGLNGYAGTTDTYLKDSSVTKNYGNDVELIAHGNPDRSALLRWDVSSIPVGSTIQSVTITLNVFNETHSVFELYELLRNWVETGATWNQAAAGQSWGAAGAQQIGVDRADTVLGTLTSPSAGQATITLNAAGIALVQSWVNNSATNRGVIIQDYANTTTDGVSFDSSEVATIANRPKLSITYLPSPGIGGGGGGGESLALRASGGSENSSQTLTTTDLNRVVPEARTRWTSVLPQAQRPAARDLLNTLTFQIANLAGDTISETRGNSIFVDVNAAGRGWYVDISPENDCEYIGRLAGHNATANQRIDLLSAITHEMGHALGIGEHKASGVMAEALSPGTRVMPKSGCTAALDALFGSGLGSILG